MRVKSNGKGRIGHEGVFSRKGKTDKADTAPDAVRYDAPEQDALANSIVDTLVLSEIPNAFPAGTIVARVEDIGISLALPADSYFFMHDSEEPFLKARYGCTAEKILKAFGGEEPNASAVMLYNNRMAYAVFPPAALPMGISAI